MKNMKPLRYAHNDGRTDLCYDDGGRYMLTCGTDGDVRIWEGIDDDDTISHRAGDTVYSIAFKNGRFFTASDSNSIQAHTFPEGLPDGIVTRFTSPVSHMILNESGSTMIAGSGDFTIKIVDIETSNHKVCRGHEAPVLSLSLDPKEEFVASSSCDGSIRIWKLDDQSCIKVLNLLPKTSDLSLSKSLSRIQWTQDGKHLLIPVDKDIQIFNRDIWDKSSTLSYTQITQTINVMCLSNDKSYIAIGCNDGIISIIDWKKNRFLQSHSSEKKSKITALAWNPSKDNQLAFCNSEGELGVIDEAVSESNIVQQEVPNTNTNNFEGVFDDDDDMLIQATSEKQSLFDNEASEDGFTSSSKPLRPLDDDSDDDFIKDIKDKDGDGDDDDDKSSIVSLPVHVPITRPIDTYKPTPLQKPFQSASTPLHLSSRFMKWNNIGIIRQYNNEEENSIDIEFHDTSTHHPMHLTNNLDYTIGDLSTQAVILTSPGDDDTPSKLTCLHFGSWDNSKEWTVSMPDGEEIQAAGIGDGWIAAGTSLRNIRLFTVAGIQQDIFTVPGPIVTIATQKNKLVIVYHKGMGVPGEQLLGLTLLTIGYKKTTILNDITLPLSPKSSLSWIGFSKEGTPFYVDSIGILKMFNKSLGGQWTQVSNTKDHIKGKSDHYWVVGLHENPQQIRCIPCKGSRYPATLPRPAVAILPYQIPLCEMTTEKSQYEESLWRSKLFSNHLPPNSYQLEELLKPSEGALMKLFALSAKVDREQRGLEVCKLMSDNTLQLAIKYASRVRKLQLAEKISQLAQSRLEEGEEEEADDNPLINNYETPDWSTTNGHDIDDDNDDNNDNDNNDDDNEDVNDDGDDTNEVDMEDQEEENNKPFGLLLGNKTKVKTTPQPVVGRSNPFKICTQEKIKKQPGKGTQIFDGMNKKVEKPKTSIFMPLNTKISKSNQKKVSTQPKIFTAKGEKSTKSTEKLEKPVKKTPNAFELWLEENKDDLKEEHADLSEEDFGVMAADSFRALSKDDRQIWIQKAKVLKSGLTGSDENIDKKKRKREEEESEDQQKNKKSQKDTEVKKPLSQSTNSKLSNFTFSKDS